MSINKGAIFDPKKAIPLEKYVTIYGTGAVDAPAQGRLLVHTDFPLSILRKHSDRAMTDDVPRRHWGAGLTSIAKHADWDIEMPVVDQWNNGNRTVQTSGLQTLLRWIIETQPAAGYPENYKGGNLKFPDDRTPADFLERLLIQKATYQLDMRANVRSPLRFAIKTQIEAAQPLTDRDLGLVIQLCDGDDDRLVNAAINIHCGQFARYSLGDAIMRPYNLVFDSSSDKVKGQWQKQWSYAQSEVRRQRRAAAAAAPAPPAGQQ